jgi:UDP-GlcNAc:undecaprenyl-phosphate GlcNAc-1-phosphate transferase
MDMDSVSLLLHASATAALALGLAYALTGLARQVALKLNVVDRPDGRRKLHRDPIPLLGGAAVYLTVATTVLLAAWLWPPTWVPASEARSLSLPFVALTCGGVICLVGLWDDLRSMRAHYKFLVQCIVLSVIISAGYGISSIFLGGQLWQLGPWGYMVSILVIAAGLNALNLLDGMDALAGTTGVIACLGIAAAAVISGRSDLALLSAGLGGALGGFLCWNRPPARIYLGDCGSLTLGLLATIMALDISVSLPGAAPGRFLQTSVFAGFLLLPILDTGLSVVRRMLCGQRIWRPDCGHIHHRLRQRGLSVVQSLVILGGLSLAGSIAGLAAWLTGIGWPVWAIMASAVVLGTLFRLAGHLECFLIAWHGLRLIGQRPEVELTDGLDSAAQSVLGRHRLTTIGFLIRDPHGKGSERDHHARSPQPHDGVLIFDLYFRSSRRQQLRVRAILANPESWTSAEWLALLDDLHALGRDWARASSATILRHPTPTPHLKPAKRKAA